MNQKPNGIGSITSKGICVALTLVLAASLFAAGAAAEAGCGKKCCKQSSQMNMHHFQGKLTPSSAGACNGTATAPCDLKTGPFSESPEFLLGSTGPSLLSSVGPANLETDFLSDHHGCANDEVYQQTRRKGRSAPLYLQNLSFLI
ncbi:MAG: hypothetical protein PVG74_21470 [Desulfobacterales bacterium]|jgi:hypothetical protein